MRCSALQCVAVHCSVLQCAAVCCSVYANFVLGVGDTQMMEFVVLDDPLRSHSASVIRV